MIKIIYKAFALFFLVSTTVLFTQCGSDKKGEIEEVNTDDIKLTIDLKRFDQDLFNARTAEEVLALEKKYPDFYSVYMYELMSGITSNGATPPLEAAANIIRNFTTVPDFGLWLKQRADSVFPSLEPFKAELTEAMKRYKYFFPQDTIPQFITFLSPLVINFPVIEGRNQIGIGLDMYLGSDFKVYHAPNLMDQFPNYRIRKMRKEYLLRDLITALSENKLQSIKGDSRLLDEMIKEGKILYMVDAILPKTEDSIKMGYTPAQLKWAEQNESDIWASLVNSEVLYTTNPMTLRDFTNDGPFTTAKDFGNGTAPRIGSYIGWRIVKQYMEKNPKITLAQLLKLVDADDILTKSKYKP
jgi:hypothetical protein